MAMIRWRPATLVVDNRVEIACLPLASVSETRSEVTPHQNASVNLKNENRCSLPFGRCFAVVVAKTPLK